jgi:signal transduction histidine kinase
MKQPFSTWFFIRSWAAIAAGIIGAALLLDFLLATVSSRNQEAELQIHYRPLFVLLQAELVAADPANRNTRLQQVTAGWDTPAQLLPLAAFAGLEDVLDTADTDLHLFYDTSGQALIYQSVQGSDQILALGPVPTGPDDSMVETAIIISYYLLIALVLLIWIRPFYRDLSLLRQGAANFGKSDFSTRVELSDKSSILPVAQSFNAMAERIEYLVSAHQELTNAVSHELRTPLARFKFSLEILGRSREPDKQQEYIAQMKDDVAELEDLIDEMLSYASLGEHNLMMNQVDIDLRSWLNEELAVYRNEPVRVTCSFAIEGTSGTCRASLNPDLMARALHNIIRNGLRYAQSKIDLHVQCNGDASITVCDDGPGIPEELIGRIFEPFSRHESSRGKDSGGYGLGLAIAERILQRHHGSLTVRNCQPNGACFLLRWPRGM